MADAWPATPAAVLAFFKKSYWTSQPRIYPGGLAGQTVHDIMATPPADLFPGV